MPKQQNWRGHKFRMEVFKPPPVIQASGGCIRHYHPKAETSLKMQNGWFNCNAQAEVRNPLADVSATMFRLSEFGPTGPGRGGGMILKVNVQTAVLKYENLSNNQPYSRRAGKVKLPPILPPCRQGR
ncbi:hypothetical protein DFH08DRAFT_823971 [Mycena albidolilacea]|uniref:Uncharacterized protein n=1 Tax=Mycena albidolilacea TaxID=1033008 RepID=A0AAD6Z5K5_9AGAR|nr:hypothetical protein DFH08DRAFT_823971 [Mycena albidolilacea]